MTPVPTRTRRADPRATAQRSSASKGIPASGNQIESTLAACNKGAILTISDGWKTLDRSANPTFIELASSPGQV